MNNSYYVLADLNSPTVNEKLAHSPRKKFMALQQDLSKGISKETFKKRQLWHGQH